MKIVLFLLLLTTFFSSQAFGDFYFSPGGIFTTSFKSKAKTSDEKELVRANSGVGLELDFETNLFWGFSFALMGSYSSSGAQVEYSYIDPQNSSVSNTTSDLESTMDMLTGYLGMRWRLINSKQFKFLVGGGVLGGSANINHDEFDFKNRNNQSLEGYKMSSSNSYMGSYYEAGLAYYWNDKNGLRLQGRQINFKTKDFETLGKTSIKANYLQVGIFYIHIIDMKALWR